MHTLIVILIAIPVIMGLYCALQVVWQILGILFGPKAIGLCMVIIGTILSFSGIGMIIGVPLILIGGCMLFA